MLCGTSEIRAKLQDFQRETCCSQVVPFGGLLSEFHDSLRAQKSVVRDEAYRAEPATYTKMFHTNI